MSLETTANANTLEQESTVASIRTFQNSKGAVGSIGESVNLFRGSVMLPLALVSLTSRDSLAAELTITYDSDVKNDVDTWNVEAPTGILGLGWSMPVEAIALDYRGTGSPFDDDYYLVDAGGGRSRLWLVAKVDHIWRFQIENAPFPAVEYDTSTETWRITRENGITSVYGGSPGALQYGVRWGGPAGNWVGSSRRKNQERFVLAWNLSAVRNPWNDAITFAYTQFPDDSIQVGGPGGLAYTRASYLARIEDPLGRVVTFGYEEKRYDEEIREFQPPHTAQGGLQVYQDRYETRYLSSIDVRQRAVAGMPDVMLFSFSFFYRLANYARVEGDPRYLFKRYLTGVTTIGSTGEVMPGYAFDYYRGDEGPAAPHRGAIKTITYPEGAVAIYTYAEQNIPDTNLALTVDENDTGAGVPRVWFGSDFIVIARYDRFARRLAINVYDWNGRWIPGKQPLRRLLDGELDLDGLQVSPGADFFLLAYKITGPFGGRLEAFAIRRDFGAFGSWTAEQLETPRLQRPESRFSADAGSAFIALAAEEDRGLYRYRWDARARRWRSDIVTFDLPADPVIAAFDSYLTLCRYDPRSQTCSLFLFFLDETRTRWNERRLGMTGRMLWEDGVPKLSWALASTFAAATYVLSRDRERGTVDYQVDLLVWDRNYENVVTERRPAFGIPADTKFPCFQSLANESMVGNAGNVFRYNGQEWVSTKVGDPPTSDVAPAFAYGNDFAIFSTDSRNAATRYEPRLDLFRSVSALPGQSRLPSTVSGNYVTVGDVIYIVTPAGELQPIGTLGTDVRAAHVANQAPSYIAFDLPDGSAYVLTTRNGVVVKSPRPLTERLFVDEATGVGTALAGPSAFVTYSGSDFDTAHSLTLHRVLHHALRGPIVDYPVARLAISDGFGGEYVTSYVCGGVSTTGPFGLATQYSRVTVVQGSSDPAVAPFGSTRYEFYNGLAPRDTGMPDVPFYAFLNGSIHLKTAFDSTGREVARDRNFWDVITRIDDIRGLGPIDIYGAYVRPARTEQTQTFHSGGTVQSLTSTISYGYQEATGLENRVTTINYNSRGALETRVTETLFAWERYPAMRDALMYVEVAQTTERVDGLVTAIGATTWRNSWGAATAWAPFREFRGLHPAASLRNSDWTNETQPPVTEFVKVAEIRARERHGLVSETIDAGGLATSTLHDNDGRFPIAHFQGSSLRDDEATWLAFETYERPNGWTLNGGELTKGIIEGDSFTGTRSLRLAAGDKLQRTLRPAPAGRDFILSCWVKTGAGFGEAPGGAQWTITSPAGIEKLPVLDTRQTWQFVHLVVNPGSSTSPVEVLLELVNGKEAPLLVTGIRFSVALGGFEATVYDGSLGLPVTRVRGNGGTDRFAYDGFRNTIADVGPEWAVTGIDREHFSRVRNGGRFDAADPNAVLHIAPQSWGIFDNLQQGNEWRARWTAAGGEWNVKGGSLIHSGEAEGSVAYAESLTGQFGLAVRARFPTPPAGSFGVNVGTLRVTWDPATAAWRIVDGDRLLAAAPRQVVARLDAAVAGDLDRGVITPAVRHAFHDAAIPLSARATITVLAGGQRWRISEMSRTWFLLRDEGKPTVIDVVPLTGDWIVLVHDESLLFYAGGSRVLSWRSSKKIEGKPGFYTTGPAAFDNLFVFGRPEVTVTFNDSTSQERQRQRLLEDGRAIASATFYDGGGRAIIHSLSAPLLPEAGRLLTYEAGLAAIDRTTWRMSGLVHQANPAAEGFCYSRVRYDDTPLSREVERGVPGLEFAIVPGATPHTLRFDNRLHDGRFGLPAEKYFVREAIDPDDRRAITVTDLSGLEIVRAALDGDGTFNVVRHVYDSRGLIVETHQPNESAATPWVTRYAYDFLGNVISKIDPDTGVTRFLNDRIGRPRFTMDASGSSAVPPVARWTKYDLLSRKVGEGWVAASWEELRSRADDALWPSETPSVRYDYDAFRSGNLRSLGLLSTRTSQRQAPTGGDDFVVSEHLDYDSSQTVVSIETVAPSFADTKFRIDYGYDNLGNTTSLTYPPFRGNDGAKVAYTFDLGGQISAISIGDVEYARYRYDSNGAVREEAISAAGGPLFTRTYDYAPPGWVSAIRDPFFSESILFTSGGVGGAGYYGGSPARIDVAPRAGRQGVAMRFAYDALGRLTKSDTGGGDPTDYGYDPNGNFLVNGGTSYHYPAAPSNQLASTSGGLVSNFDYDSAGNLAKETSRSLTLQYDLFRGKAIRASVRVASAEVSLDFRYDGLGRRVCKMVSSGAVSRAKLYLRGVGSSPLVELYSDGRSVQFVNGPAGPVLVLSGGQPHILCRDHLGSIRTIVRAGGEVVAAHDYTPFGEFLGAASGTDPAFLGYYFNGREMDETLLYDLLARFYDARLGRFVSPDPEGQFPSPYVYCGNDPLRFVDPNGEASELLIALLIGVIIGALAGAVSATVTIIAQKLEGGKAAGVFFADVALNAAAGFINVIVPAVAVSLAFSEIKALAGIVAGVVAGAATSAAIGAADAALLNEDAGKGAWQGALSGGASSLVGGLISEGETVIRWLRYRKAQAPWSYTAIGPGPKTWEVVARKNSEVIGAAVAGGVAGGVTSSVVGAALSGASAEETLHSLAQGVAFGIFGALADRVAYISIHGGFQRNQIRGKKLRPRTMPTAVLNELKATLQLRGVIDP